MKTLKRIIYALLGLVLTGAVVLVGVILFAEYGGQRFAPVSSDTVQTSGEESRLVYDENGNLAELPEGLPAATAEGNADTGSESMEDSSADSTGTNAETADALTSAAPNEGLELPYVMDMGSALFHYSDCPYVENISEENRSDRTTTRGKIIDAGYEPCSNCNP